MSKPNKGLTEAKKGIEDLIAEWRDSEISHWNNALTVEKIHETRVSEVDFWKALEASEQTVIYHSGHTNVPEIFAADKPVEQVFAADKPVEPEPVSQEQEISIIADQGGVTGIDLFF